MKKLTPAQQKIVDRMRAGEYLQYTDVGWVINNRDSIDPIDVAQLEDANAILVEYDLHTWARINPEYQ